MTQSVREQLEALNEECKAFCLDESNWASTKWRGTGFQGTPNFRLLYSAPETFESPGRMMILGTNPGGDHTNADDLDPDEPFQRGPDYSAYVSDRWPEPRGTSLMNPGTHPIQRAVRDLAAVLGRAVASDGDELLRGCPSGNLIPFRSRGFPDLPSSLRVPGLAFGWGLLSIAQPQVVVLLASNAMLWKWLMAKINHDPTPDFAEDMGANFTFREAQNPDGDWPKLIFALPGFNTSTQGQNRKALRILRKRLAEHGLAVA